MEAIFCTYDNYSAIWKKFKSAWPNLRIELRHPGGNSDNDERNDLDWDETFGDLNKPNELMFTLIDQTIARVAIKLISDHCGGEAFILRDNIAVESEESLGYCNNPFRLPLNEFSYGEFKSRFSERWPNLSIELYDTSPQPGGLRRGIKELPDDFDLKQLKHGERAYLHDYVYIYTWSDWLKFTCISAAIKNNKLEIYCEGDLSYRRLKDLEAMESDEKRSPESRV